MFNKKLQHEKHENFDLIFSSIYGVYKQQSKEKTNRAVAVVIAVSKTRVRRGPETLLRTAWA